MSEALEVSGRTLVEVALFRKDDFSDLEKWAEEMGISTDELASQIVRKAARFLSARKHDRDNVVALKPKG